MKSTTTKEERLAKGLKIFFATLWIFMMCVFLSGSINAQEKKESEWKEVTVSEIPYSVEIHTGVTKNGNPKYWIEIQGIKVTISESNYNKFINKEVKLVLVEWYNTTTDRYKYTTRQAEKSKKTSPKLNMDNLWQS